MTAATHSTFDPQRALLLACDTLDIEARAVQGLKARLGDSFAQAVKAMLTCRGRVVVTGMGKSGHVGRKIAATLSSTGTPAFFLHPGEASHGDLGVVTPQDVVLAISNSGESDELNAIMPTLKRLGVVCVAMTGRPESSLARHADFCISSAVDQEACPLNLAPTASTTAQMALGDALAVSLLDARGFREEDFARSHPGGSLGRRLLIRVSDLMRQGDRVPRIGPEALFIDLVHEMTEKAMGISAIVDDVGHVLGVFTDGDLRRLIERGGELRSLRAHPVMTRTPCVIGADALAAEAATLMENCKVTSVLVVDSGNKLVGALNANTLMRAKVI